ncbi:hypothetical protein [Caulobacter hibisci]|uniref:AAA+ ATPase domain-containing protein n=1 Tax=Caulobacter hibisci TaxID=2035993 RepID=A0ABS0SZV4_9CAUL|nr:hypothetical protein [Caulobacter hibisci]MBI1685167.1 hypothetical protein [Caulobacter hibisci]
MDGENETSKGRDRVSARSTSGAGFSFEDLIAADQLTRMLADEPALPLAVPSRLVEFQLPPDQSLIDDLRITGIDAGTGNRRLTISCKSNLQVTARALPREFVELAWSQWRRPDLFDRDMDQMALAIRGRHAQFQPLWHDIKTWLSGDTLEIGLSRIHASNRHRAIFDSVALGEGSVETAHLIRRLDVLASDFQLTPSMMEEAAVARARSVLCDASPEQGRDLWSALVKEAHDARVGGGSIALEPLIGRLRDRHALKGHPATAPAWTKLKALSAQQQATVQTRFHDGHHLERDTALLTAALEKTGCCLVTGESGTGKSAWVKAGLAAGFPAARQLWLGPDEAQQALSGLGPQALNLQQLLARSEKPHNILVLDAVERFAEMPAQSMAIVVRSLVERLRAGERTWRVVVIGQGIAQDTHVRALWQAIAVGPITPPLLTEAEIRAILQRSPRLRAHAYDGGLVAALGNIRTLAWLASVPAADGSEKPSLALPDIADMLWDHWTTHDINQHSLLIRLAKREADYERSFAVSLLDAGDRAALKAGQARLPLVMNDRYRVRFEHDLASDWARYQALKEMDDPRAWARLADRPLWLPALRLLGLHLLHRSDQAGDGWDAAFEALQDPKDAAAADLLLDALFLDPNAEVFLSRRADRLLADKGALLDRLLRRFMHVASTPNGVQSDDADVSLYIESHYRTPILRHWPPMLRFLAAHHDKVAALGSSVVAKVCGAWLEKTPTMFESSPFPARREAAILALASARTEQVMSVAHGCVGRGGDDGNPLYVAALAAAAELPDEVAAFALELAGRRPLDPQTAARVDAIHAKDRARRRAAQAANQKRRRPKAAPLSWSPRPLPPWPLGPAGRIDDSFRRVVLDPLDFTPLAVAMPAVAREVLLACIVEDRPHESYGSMLDDPLGLEHDHDCAPMIHWKSPFFAFLNNSPDEAVTAVLALTAFCTERWAEAQARRGEKSPILRLADGEGRTRDYVGGSHVLAWAQCRRHGNLQLYGALDALERWLLLRCGAGDDLTPTIGRLLNESNSVAILGVLCGLAKHRPELLEGCLAPLLTCPDLFDADETRSATARYEFDGFGWSRMGERLWQLARDWEFAAHRVISLAEVVRERRQSSPSMEATLMKAVTLWPQVLEGRDQLVRRLLLARLDPVHWVQRADSDGKLVWTFECPAELSKAIAGHNGPQQDDEPVTAGAIVDWCRSTLNHDDFNEGQAEALLGYFDDVSQMGVFDPSETLVIECALGGLLLTRGSEQIRARRECAEAIAAVLERHSREILLKASREEVPRLALRWACLGALNGLLTGVGARADWAKILARGLARGDGGVITQTSLAIFPRRREIPVLWTRVVTLSILGAALQALTPDTHEPGSRARADRWRERLAGFDLTASGTTAPTPLSVAMRVERLWRSRFRRAGQPGIPAPWRAHRRRYAYGLQRQGVQALYQWSLDREATPSPEDLDDHRTALRDLWAFIDWTMHSGRESDTDDDTVDRADDFGHTAIRAIAARVRVSDVERGRPLWEPILALGPAGEYTVEHFIDVFFLRAYDEADAEPFVANWEAMLEFVFAPGWADRGRYYHASDLRRHMLGLDAADAIGRSPGILAHVPRLARFYEAFAETHLARDDRALRDYARFLTRSAGAALRAQALDWLNGVLVAKSSLRDGAGSALAELVMAILKEDAARLKSDAGFRDPLLVLVGHLARIGTPDALVLQDRVRRSI